eukprot:Tbor_TRINITY_DN2755_c0_g1::TRINITY_DN2755_c0_g1_i1::g.15217::m.15217
MSASPISHTDDRLMSSNISLETSSACINEKIGDDSAAFIERNQINYNTYARDDKKRLRVGPGFGHQSSSCPICLEGYSLENPAVLFPCRHAFHVQCIDSWMIRARRKNKDLNPNVRSQTDSSTPRSKWTCPVCGVVLHRSSGWLLSMKEMQMSYEQFCSDVIGSEATRCINLSASESEDDIPVQNSSASAASQHALSTLLCSMRNEQDIHGVSHRDNYPTRDRGRRKTQLPNLGGFNFQASPISERRCSNMLQEIVEYPGVSQERHILGCSENGVPIVVEKSVKTSDNDRVIRSYVPLKEDIDGFCSIDVPPGVLSCSEAVKKSLNSKDKLYNSESDSSTEQNVFGLMGCVNVNPGNREGNRWNPLNCLKKVKVLKTCSKVISRWCCNTHLSSAVDSDHEVHD